MTPELEKELDGIKHCFILNSVHVDDWTTELEIIASNVCRTVIRFQIMPMSLFLVCLSFGTEINHLGQKSMS